jgi:ubiquinone/menaquinone biosynthesis C-methylase UbiE
MTSKAKALVIAALGAALVGMLLARRRTRPQLEADSPQPEAAPTRQEADPLLEALEPQPKDRVLQLGLAEDELTLSVAERLTGGKLEVLGREQDAVEALAERARARGLSNVSGWHGDPEDLLFEADRFEAALVLEGAGDAAVRRELERVVKPGGRLVVREGERYLATFVAEA